MFVIVGFIVLALILKILSVPLKVAFKLFINAVAGALVLLMVNLILSNFGNIIPTTPLNCILVGIFGIPAVLIMVLVYVL